MLKNKRNKGSVVMIWFLACLGVIYLAVDMFGEGENSATVSAIGVFLLTAYYFTKKK